MVYQSFESVANIQSLLTASELTLIFTLYKTLSSSLSDVDLIHVVNIISSVLATVCALRSASGGCTPVLQDVGTTLVFTVIALAIVNVVSTLSLLSARELTLILTLYKTLSSYSH